MNVATDPQFKEVFTNELALVRSCQRCGVNLALIETGQLLTAIEIRVSNLLNGMQSCLLESHCW